MGIGQTWSISFRNINSPYNRGDPKSNLYKELFIMTKLERFVVILLIGFIASMGTWTAMIMSETHWKYVRAKIATELFKEEEEYLRGKGYCTDVLYEDLYENDRVYVCNLVMEDGNVFETAITKDCGNIYTWGYMDYIQPYWES